MKKRVAYLDDRFQQGPIRARQLLHVDALQLARNIRVRLFVECLQMCTDNEQITARPV